MRDFSLGGQRDCTAQHNDIVPVLLGLTKFLDTIAERARTEAPLGRSDRPSAATKPDDEDLILAVLGLLSIRATLRRWLGQCEMRSLPSDFAQFETKDAETDLLR